MSEKVFKNNNKRIKKGGGKIMGVFIQQGLKQTSNK
jgi:hypothetical protein